MINREKVIDCGDEVLDEMRKQSFTIQEAKALARYIADRIDIKAEDSTEGLL
jgi:RecB family exonuclease